MTRASCSAPWRARGKPPAYPQARFILQGGRAADHLAALAGARSARELRLEVSRVLDARRAGRDVGLPSRRGAALDGPADGRPLRRHGRPPRGRRVSELPPRGWAGSRAALAAFVGELAGELASRHELRLPPDALLAQRARVADDASHGGEAPIAFDLGPVHASVAYEPRSRLQSVWLRGRRDTLADVFVGALAWTAPPSWTPCAAAARGSS